MKLFGKITFGLAIAGLLVGQSAFAASPRAGDRRTGNASTGRAVDFRPLVKVAGTKVASLDLLIAGLASVSIIGGAVLIANANNNDNDAPASP